MPRQLSLHVVGVAHLNKRGGSDRRFEILLCPPGEPVDLVPEPSNPVDPQAVAVYSARGIQIGYLTAERALWIGSASCAKVVAEKVKGRIARGNTR